MRHEPGVTRDILLPEGARWREVSDEEARRLPCAAIASLRLHIVGATGAQAFFAGTGWFVAPNAVVTAAHVTQVEEAWSKVPSAVSWHLEVVPGLVRGQRPFGETWARRVERHPQWSGVSASDFDIALILVTPLAGGASNLFLRVEPFAFGSPESSNVEVVGYPFAQFRGETAVRHAGPVRAIEGQRLFYDIDTEDGQSGAPVLLDRGDARPSVVGIHSAGQGIGTGPLARSLNVAVALRPDLLQWMRSIIEAE